MVNICEIALLRFSNWSQWYFETKITNRRKNKDDTFVKYCSQWDIFRCLWYFAFPVSFMKKWKSIVNMILNNEYNFFHHLSVFVFYFSGMNNEYLFKYLMWGVLQLHHIGYCISYYMRYNLWKRVIILYDLLVG